MNFEEDVIRKSAKIPVLVDFWAEWCGPCKVLGPVLDELAAESAGEWELVKVNTEENEELSQRFGIRSIPAVKLFHKGKIVSEFSGALPRDQIKAWLDHYLPSEKNIRLKALMEEAEAGDLETEAVEKFLNKYPDSNKARILYAKLKAFESAPEALGILSDLPRTPDVLELEEDIRSLEELLHFADDTESPATPKLLNAAGLLQENKLNEFMEYIIEAVMLDKSVGNDLPRRLAISVFRILGNQHPVVLKYRRRFDMALY